MNLKKTFQLAPMVICLLFLRANTLGAQATPTDFVSQLPDILKNVCTVSNADADAYGKTLLTFSEKVEAQLDHIATLENKAKVGAKARPDADISELAREYERARKMIADRDFASEFDKALHNEAGRAMEQRLEEILKKITPDTPPDQVVALQQEAQRVKSDYCTAASPRFMELLSQQRAWLQKEVGPIVAAADLKQKIECAVYGYTYFPEISYHEAYQRITEHLSNMVLLLSYNPGNE